MIHCFSPS